VARVTWLTVTSTGQSSGQGELRLVDGARWWRGEGGIGVGGGESQRVTPAYHVWRTRTPGPRRGAGQATPECTPGTQRQGPGFGQSADQTSPSQRLCAQGTNQPATAHTGHTPMMVMGTLHTNTSEARRRRRAAAPRTAVRGLSEHDPKVDEADAVVQLAGDIQSLTYRQQVQCTCSEQRSRAAGSPYSNSSMAAPLTWTHRPT
jgi:hypothetical protein